MHEGKYCDIPIVEGKYFACKKSNDRNKNASDNLKKIQLV
jgi:hypothetical protein